MIRLKKILFLAPFFLLILVFSTEAKKRRPKKVKSKPEPEITVQTDSTGMPIRKKRTPDEIFNALHSVLRAMTEDMDEFNFNKIHPHLKIVYALYNELRLLATDDSLLNNSGIPDTLINAKTINFNLRTLPSVTPLLQPLIPLWLLPLTPPSLMLFQLYKLHRSNLLLMRQQ
jgi:hypothetical protein